MKLRLIILSVLSFLIATAAVSAALRSVFPARFEVYDKIKLAAADQNTDVVFFGTSRVEFGFIPDVFDRQMQQHGIAVHSYNAGQRGANILEIAEQIKALFAMKPCCVKYVFAEPDYASLYIFREPNTLRAINFASLPNSYAAFRFLRYPDQPPQPAMSLIESLENIATSTIRHYFNIGLAHIENEQDTDISLSARGYPVNEEKMIHKRLQLTAVQKESYDTSLTRISSAIDQSHLISDYQASIIVRLASFVKSHGAELILVRPPHIVFSEYEGAAVSRIRTLCHGEGPRLLDFANPAKHPVLFVLDNRSDEDHLNIHGAALFSEQLADEFATKIKAEDHAAIDTCDD